MVLMCMKFIKKGDMRFFLMTSVLDAYFQFSEWGRVEAPDSAIFTVTVEELDGPDGEPIYSARGFTDRDQKRLTELEDKYLNQN